LIDRLNGINGDPVLLIEFFTAEETIFYLPTNPRLLVQSFKNGTSCVLEGDLPKI
jgi:hypothetical protein